MGAVKRFLAVATGTVGACLALLAGAPAAHADAVDDAVAALRSAPVHVAPGVDSPTVDQAAARSAIGSRRIKIAVLPADDYGTSAKAYDAARQIGQALSPDQPLTVGVVAGRVPIFVGVGGNATRRVLKTGSIAPSNQMRTAGGAPTVWPTRGAE